MMDDFAPGDTLTNRMVPDQALARLFARNAPHVSEDEMWERLQPRIKGRAPRRSRRARPERTRRLGLILTVVALVAAIAVGIYAAATWLGDDEYIVVIDDDPMRPSGVTAAGPTTTAAATETTAAPATTTAAGAFYDPEPFELDLGPIDRLNLAEAWAAIAERAGLDARAARAHQYALDYSGDGVLRGLSLLVTLSDTRVLAVECDAMEGKKGERAIATVRPTDAPSFGPAVADDRLYEVFAAIDQVGVEQIIAKLPRAGAGGYYRLGAWPPDTELPLDQEGYMWNGSAFNLTSASFGSVRPDPARWVWIPATTLALDDGGGATPTTSYTASVPVHFFVGIPQPAAVTPQAAPTGAGLTDPEFAPLVEALEGRGGRPTLRRP